MKKAPGKNQVSSPLHNHGLSYLGSDILRGAPEMVSGIDIRSLVSRAKSETEIIRILNNHTSILSSAVFHMTEMANTKLNIKAKDRTTGVIDKLGTDRLRTVIQGLDDPDKSLRGFNHKKGITSLNGTLLQEVMLSGAASAELVLLGASREPSYLVPIPVETYRWEKRSPEGIGSKILVPVQNGVTLDYPNIFYSSLHQQANTSAPVSMLQPAVGVVANFSRFMEDLNEVIDISGHSRLTITLDKEQLMKMMPDECRDDPVKSSKWLEDQRGIVTAALEQLKPEQALVLWGEQKAEILGGSNIKSDYSDLLGTLLGILALSLKSNSTLLGLRLSGGSQNMSSTESLMAIKVAASLQKPVSEIWSRVGNLILQLSGFQNLTCLAEFQEIELRPSLELESHKLIRQKRILEQLSLGFISDEQAADELGLHGLPPGFEKLSGTGFFSTNGDVNMSQAISNSQDAAGRTLTPKDAKG